MEYWSTIVVAVAGIAGTLLAAILTTNAQTKAAMDRRVLDFTLDAYASCTESLYEQLRVTYNRAHLRLAKAQGAHREAARHEDYVAKAGSDASIARVRISAKATEIGDALTVARGAIDCMTDVETSADLASSRVAAVAAIDAFVQCARESIHPLT